MTTVSEFVPFAAIVVCCYLIGAIFKAINLDELNRFIPIICGIVGGVLGVVVFKTIPGYIPAENWLVALCIGIVSGFASTGINQVYQQFKKDDYIEDPELAGLDDEEDPEADVKEEEV